MAIEDKRFLLDGEEVNLAEFIADNADDFDATVIALIDAMEPGDDEMFGGGAGATFVLTREA